MARFLYLDPGLGLGRSGHPYSIARALRAAVQSRALEWRAWGYRGGDADILGELGSEPCFAVLPEGMVSHDPAGLGIDALVATSFYFADDLLRIGGDFGPADTLFFPYAHPPLLYAAWRLLAGIEPARRPALRASVTFRWDPGADKGLDAAFRAAMRLLAEAPNRARFFADTQAQADAAAAISGMRVAELPLPLSDDLPAPAPRAAGPLRVAYLGEPRSDKGFTLLPDLIARLGARADLEWIVQTASPYAPKPDAAAAIARLVPGPGLRLLEVQADRAAYLGHLAGADIVLCLYDSAAYRVRSSGVLAEALAAGKVVVVPAGTAMAQAAAVGGAVEFARNSLDDMTDAIGRALRDFEALEARARAAAQQFRARQTGAHALDLLAPVA